MTSTYFSEKAAKVDYKSWHTAMTPAEALGIQEKMGESLMARLRGNDHTALLAQAIDALALESSLMRLPPELAGFREEHSKILKNSKERVEEWGPVRNESPIEGVILTTFHDSLGERVDQAHTVIAHAGFMMNRAEESLIRDQSDLKPIFDCFKVEMDSVMAPRKTAVQPASHEFLVTRQKQR